MTDQGWQLADLPKVSPNGKRVFSTFACGGGSTMGYKLAGYEVVGANDIDPEMAEVYQATHKPKHYYLKPIGQLVEQLREEGLPEHLQGLDILDGSPPCSSFSTSGNRERDWGKDRPNKSSTTCSSTTSTSSRSSSRGPSSLRMSPAS